MKRLFTTALITLGLLYSGSALAATSLSDTELAEVSGGGIDPHLGGQSLSQGQQKPEKNNSGSAPLLQPQSIDGMELTPELFAILQSRIDTERTRALLLNGTTQQNAVALNLENTLSSDIASINNIFNGGSLTLDDVTTEIEINQGNSVNQRHRTQGSLTSSIASHRYEKSELRRSGTESYEFRAYSLVDQNRRSEYLRTFGSGSSAQVGITFTSLDDFTANALPLAILEPTTFVKIFDFPAIGGTLDAGWFGEYGATLDYTGIQFIGPGLTIDTIRAGGTDNKDLVFGTSMTAPKLDFGDLDGKLCVGTCGEAHWDFGYLGGGQINPEFVLKDMAFELDELSLGTGFDFAGSGSESPLSTTPGLFKVDGNVSLKVTPYASVTLDLRELEIASVDVGQVIIDLNIFGNGQAIKRHEWSLNLIDRNFAFNLLDEEIKIDSTDLELGDRNHFFTERLISLDNDAIVESDAIDIATSSFSESYRHSAFTGGQMTGAEAELLAMSDGSLTVDNNNTVALSNNAQQNMRVFNSVNAVSSIAANAMNMSKLSTFKAGPSATPRISIQQMNRFDQQK